MEGHHYEVLHWRRTHIALDEMMTYRSSVEKEGERLQRAMKAGTLLADLKVTHCPV